MKTNEYIKRFVDEKKRRINFDGIMEQLALDFNEEINKAGNGMPEFEDKFTYDKFEKCISIIKQKFDNIHAKLPGKGMSEKSWGYFFARTVCKKRDELFDIKFHKEG